MRLFVGIDVGEPIARAAGRVIDQLRRRAEREAPKARLAWIPTERLHITVRFIGEVDEAQVDAIRVALEPPLDVPSFELQVGGIGTFPPKRRPRVIWAGVMSGLPALREIERRVSGRLNPLVGSGDERGYTPHLTLARVKDANGLSAGIVAAVAGEVLGTTRVECVTLFESRPSPRGPTYVTLQRAVLHASSPT